jgi:hypothetical protein
MAKNYLSGMKSASQKLEKAQNKYASFAGEVAKLPYQLQDEYRKAQDPALSQKINESQQNVLGGAIAGLDKYKDISDPTQRRALAEKYQSGLSIDYTNLTDERTRREGVYNDYIQKWTGLYGAEAAKRQAEVSAMESAWSRDMNLAQAKQSQANYESDAAESRRRWDYEQAHKGGSGGGSVAGGDDSYLSYAKDMLESSVEMNGGKGYHSDVYTKLLINAPNAKTREAIKEYFSGGLDAGGKEKLNIKNQSYVDPNKEEKSRLEIEKLRMNNQKTLLEIERGW